MLEKYKAAKNYHNLGIALKKRPRVVLENSEALARIDYNKENNNLVVEFKHGGVYQYKDVKPDDFYQIFNSDSAGSFFVKEIKNRHEFIKLS